MSNLVQHEERISVLEKIVKHLSGKSLDQLAAEADAEAKKVAEEKK